MLSDEQTSGNKLANNRKQILFIIPLPPALMCTKNQSLKSFEKSESVRAGNNGTHSTYTRLCVVELLIGVDSLSLSPTTLPAAATRKFWRLLFLGSSSRQAAAAERERAPFTKTFLTVRLTTDVVSGVSRCAHPSILVD